LEIRKKEIEAMLVNPDFYKNSDEAKLISAEYKVVQIQIEQAFTNWSDLTHQLEQAEKNV
jgi:protein subunit release factor A